ncbi:unnamed protein product [Closterium sp. NIES-65]|nr:unnamed protein product [Closterium sp. NIES-65]
MRLAGGHTTLIWHDDPLVIPRQDLNTHLLFLRFLLSFRLLPLPSAPSAPFPSPRLPSRPCPSRRLIWHWRSSSAEPHIPLARFVLLGVSPGTGSQWGATRLQRKQKGGGGNGENVGERGVAEGTEAGEGGGECVRMGTGSGVTLGKGEIERFRPGGLRVQRAHGGQRRRHGALKPHVLPSPPLCACLPPPSVRAFPPPLCVPSPPLCACLPPPSVCALPPPLCVPSPPLCVCLPPPSVCALPPPLCVPALPPSSQWFLSDRLYSCNGLMAGEGTPPSWRPGASRPAFPPPPFQWLRAGGLLVQRPHGGGRYRHGARAHTFSDSPHPCSPTPPLRTPPSGSAQVDYACNGLMAGDATVMAPAPAPSPDSPSPPPPPSTTPSPPPPSGGTPPTKGVLCPASTFDGYEYQLELGSGNYLLHWKFASNTVINFLLEARSNTIIKDAWMAVGFSKKGKMKGSDAVIGNLPGVGAFYMSGYRLKDIQQTSLPLGTTSVSTTSEGGTSIAFSRTVGTGNVPLKLNTTSYLIWAFAQTVTKKLYFHGMNQGGYALDWACYQAPKALWGGGPDYDSDDSDVDKDYSGGPWQGASLPTDAAAGGGLTATLADQGQTSSAGAAGAASADAAAGAADAAVAGAGNRKSGVSFYDGAAGHSNGEWWQERSP